MSTRSIKGDLDYMPKAREPWTGPTRHIRLDSDIVRVNEESNSLIVRVQEVDEALYQLLKDRFQGRDLDEVIDAINKVIVVETVRVALED